MYMPFGHAWYVEIAAGLTKLETTQPEVNLPSPLIKGVVGIEDANGWHLEFEHISSIPRLERGSGLNVLWIGKRVHF